MFRIKTALLACLLLVCSMCSVSALSHIQETQLTSFGEFVADDHKSSVRLAQIHSTLTHLTDNAIYYVFKLNFDEATRDLLSLMQAWKSYKKSLLALTNAKGIPFEEAGLDRKLADILTAINDGSARTAMDDLRIIQSFLKGIEPK